MCAVRTSRNHTQIKPFFRVFHIKIIPIFDFKCLDVRYTNYVRVNGFLHNDENGGPERVDIPQDTTSTDTNHLLPANDPEHDGEVRYKRIPPEGRCNGPARIHVIFSTYYFHIFSFL